jgi:hypothetical protein
MEATASRAEPWLPLPAGRGRHAAERQQQDPGSTPALVTTAVGLRRRLYEQGVFTADDGGARRAEAGNLLNPISVSTRSRGSFTKSLQQPRPSPAMPRQHTHTCGSSRQSSPVVHLAF